MSLGETSLKESRLDPGVARLAATQLHPVGASSCNFGDGLLQDSALEVEAREFVPCVAGWKAGGDQLLVDGPPALFAVVVRACAAGQEPETIPQRRQRRAIGVGHRTLEPTDHPGAASKQTDATLPGLPEPHINPIRAPHRA